MQQSNLKYLNIKYMHYEYKMEADRNHKSKISYAKNRLPANTKPM